MWRYRRLMIIALRRWRALGCILLLTIITPAVTALAPWPMKVLVDNAAGDEPVAGWLGRVLEAMGQAGSRPALLVVAGVASLGLFLLSSGLDAVLSFTWTAAGQGMVYDLAGELFARLQRLSLLFHSRQAVGDSLSRISGDSWCIYTMTEAVLVAPAQHALTLITVGAIAWRLDPVLMLLSLTIAPALGASVLFFGPKLKRRAQLQRKTESRLVSFVHQTLSSIPLVQAFATQERNIEEYRQIADGAVALTQKAVVLKNAYAVFVGFVGALGIALVLYIGAQRVRMGALSIGGLLVFVAYLRTLQGAAQGLLQIHWTLKSAQASGERVLEILQSEELVVEKPGAAALAIPAGARGVAIDFEHVTFGYEAGRAVLSGIDLHVEPGSVVALVGATGAGKSTLGGLVQRLFDPWQGVVRLEGQDVRELTLRSVRQAVGLVPQDPFLLPLSIEENIAFGRPDATNEQIRRAAEAASAGEFIQRLPRGYQTVIGERGSTLSGGQRQRIAIARALLKDAPVLILDEPTSNLDARTEREVMEALRRLMEGRTCLVIAHRLSTVRRADQIIVLEQGRIVERGTHAELIRHGGVYQRLCRLQHVEGNGEVAG